MRFLLDNDVDAEVGRMLRRHGHECHTAPAAGVATARDDQPTVFAHDRDLVLVTVDVKFSHFRRQNVVGRHVQLRCNDWEAASVMEAKLEELVGLLRKPDVTVVVSRETIRAYYRYGADADPRFEP